MSSTQIIQVSMANLQLGPKLCTYEEIYRDISDLDPYARTTGTAAADVAFSMKYLYTLIDETTGPINMTMIQIQASWQMGNIEQSGAELFAQGPYQAKLISEARALIRDLFVLEFLDPTKLPNIFREIKNWITRNDERHECIIDAINDKSLKELTLAKKNSILSTVPWAQIGDTALKISMAAVFPNASTITDAGSSAIQTITVLSNGSINDVTRKICISKIFHIGKDNNKSTNCLGSLLHINSSLIDPIPILNTISRNTRQDSRYQKLIRRNLMTEIAINLNSISNKAHIEIPVKDQTYDYQGPLYKFIHWASDAESTIFDGKIDDSSNVSAIEHDDDSEYHNRLNTNCSSHWGYNLSLEEMANHVNAILDNAMVTQEHGWKFPNVDPEALHNRLSSINNISDMFALNDYGDAYSNPLLSDTGPGAGLIRYKVHIEWKSIRANYDTRQRILYNLLGATKYSQSSNPELLQNIVATYNDMVKKITIPRNAISDQRLELLPTEKAIEINLRNHKVTAWKTSLASWQIVSNQFKSNINMDIPGYDLSRSECILPWASFQRYDNMSKYSSIEGLLSFDIKESNYQGAKSLAALWTYSNWHHHHKMTIFNMIIYKDYSNWKANSIEIIDLPELPKNAIIKYEMNDRLIYHGRIDDIVSANRWTTIIPFDSQYLRFI